MPTVTKHSLVKSRKKKGGGVIDRIAPIKLVESGMRINIYGRSGTGKTTIACTFPKPLLLIGAEDGTRSVHSVKGVDFVRLNESGELSALVDHCKHEEHYQTVVLDTATSLQDMILKELMGVDELPAQGSWGMADRNVWGQCTLQTKERLRSLLNLPCNVVILAQEREFNNEGESEVLIPYVGSALTPSNTGWLNPACDYICQAFIRQRTEVATVKIGKEKKTVQRRGKGVEYCLRTGPHDVYTTKFRRPIGEKALPEVLVDPDYDDLISLVAG